MISFISKGKSNLTHKMISSFVAFTFIFSMIVPPQTAHAQETVLNLPVPGTVVPMSDGYVPTLIKGVTVNPDNPMMFDFIIDTGDSGLKGQELKDESNKLIKYFFAAITTPDEDMWVNLSPYEKDRIIPEGFGDTEMGRDLLAQDYILKQLSASLMNPEDELGAKFWDRVYKKAQDMYGTTDIPMNTFNKIWIVPEKALVYEKDNSAFVVNTQLKVMLEEDYVALQKNKGVEKYGLDSLVPEDAEVISGTTSDVIRNVLIPEIQKEVNEGKNFAPLRQVFNAMILSTWYKKNLKESLLGKVYMDQNKTLGVDVQDKQINQKIYNQYVEAFKKGVYNYIREDYDPATKEVIPRKYFSGGSAYRPEAVEFEKMDTEAEVAAASRPDSEASRRYDVKAVGVENVDDEAMVTGQLSAESQRHYDGYRKIIDTVRTYLPGAIFMPGFSRRQVDTRKDKSDPESDRDMILDPEFPEYGGTVIGIPAADPRDVQENPGLKLSLVRFPIIFEKDNIPPEIQALVDKSKDGKALSSAVQNYLIKHIKADHPDFEMETESKTRSEKRGDILARGDVMEYIASDNIFVETGDGRIIGWLPFWIERDEYAMQKLEMEFAQNLKKQKASFARSAEAAQFENEREEWSVIAENQLAEGKNALDVLSANTHHFVEEIMSGNTESVPLLKKILSSIKADNVINYEKYGIEFDNEFNRNRSKLDMNFAIPGYGNHLMLHLAEVVSLDLLLRFMDITIMPSADPETRVGKAIDDVDLQNAAISLYFKLYTHLLDQGESVGVAEASRMKIGEFAAKLNAAIRDNDAIEINGKNAEQIVDALALKGIVLRNNEVEKLNNLVEAYADKGYVWADNIAQLAEVLDMDTFIDVFRSVKVAEKRDILPSEKPNPLFKGGAGDISSTVFMGRIASDIKLREKDPEYIGKASVQTRGLKVPEAEKPEAAVALVAKMFGDNVVRTAADLTVDGVHISKLFDDGEIQLKVSDQKAYAALDKLVKVPIDSTYVVDIVFRGDVIGHVYVTETLDFKAKMESDENQAKAMEILRAADFVPTDREVTKMDNIPDPLLVVTDDGEEIFFGDVSDGTPGGVQIGDLNVTKDSNGKAFKATTFQQFAYWAINPEDTSLGKDADEARRLKGLIAQVNKRIAGENLIVDSEQIYKKLVMLMGGGFHISGENVDKIPYLKDGTVLFFSPTSCSTTGNNFITEYESVVFGLGRTRKLMEKVRNGEIDLTSLTSMLSANDVIDTISKAMPTAHGYTGSDTGKGKIYGGERPGGTGAANGAVQHFMMAGFAAGDRTPGAVVDGVQDTPGGSMYDMLVEYPGDISEEALVNLFLRAEIGDPNAISVAKKPTLPNNGFEWKYIIGGKQTGSIVIKVEKLYGNVFRIRVGYDNVMGFSHENAVLHERLAKLRIMQKETERRRVAINDTGDQAMTVKELSQIPQSELKGKVVAVRADFNVPLKEGQITDDTRIQAGLATIKYLVDAGAKVVVTSHLGRPKGQIVDELSLAPVARRLNELLPDNVVHFNRNMLTMSQAASYIRDSLKEGQVLLLENTRFNFAEDAVVNAEKKLKAAKKAGQGVEDAQRQLAEAKELDRVFAQGLYKGADLFVLDGFSVAHRAHVSVVGAANDGIPSVAGFLVAEEVNGLANVLATSDVIVMGGSKVTDKIKVITNLLARPTVKKVLIGGAMANAFFVAQGATLSDKNAGIEEGDVAAAKALLSSENADKLVLPTDVIVVPKFTSDAEGTTKDVGDIGADDIVVDIGPKTISDYSEIIEASELPFWNGPMGAFDKVAAAEVGTKMIAQAIAKAKGSAGGGDSLAAINKYGIEGFSYVSKAGGATLEMLEGKTLPGIASLDKPDADEAMNGKNPEYGGINLNPALLNLQIKRDGNGIPLPVSQQPIESMQIDGILPVIINITPVNNMQMLMGFNQDEEVEQLSYAVDK